MWSNEEQAEIARELKRIGIQSGERLPLPRSVRTAPEYLDFLRAVPSDGGVAGFTQTMSEWRQTRAT
jgi:hypothetical protein